MSLNLIWLIILLYKLEKHLVQKDGKYLSLFNIIYISFPLLIAITTLFIEKENIFYLKVVFILPVLFAASVMGKTAGIVMSTVCSFFIVVYEMIAKGMYFFQAFESSLIMISIMYIVGWFVGVLIDNNVQYQEQLKENILSLNEEIEHRKQTERQNQKLSSVVEQSPNIIMILDTEGKIEYVNPRFTEITGYPYDNAIGKELKPGGLASDEFEKFWEVIQSGGVWQGEFCNKKKNGDDYWEFATISPFRNPDGAITNFIKIAEDITERKKVEKEMERLERMHLVGEMAAGIGHEIRNPMTTVRGFLQMLQRKDEYIKHRGYFNLMVEELDRANSIITEYLSLARNRVVNFKMQNLNSIVEALSPLILADAINFDKNIKFELGDISDLFLDEREMRQLILNLVRNGLEAMSPGGNLTVGTFMDGDEVVLSVQDQGPGIEPDVLDKIGDPFFTTKENGTGLGLSVCYSIVARHNAAINVKTGPTGTTFFVAFKPGCDNETELEPDMNTAN
ncbi:MAG: Sporulation kinase E [Pelotomaculum sp. PtaB.Bin104]|nr:MAG: Sporulation kinase E [Pelotomaculum sp. PtaB.Bin104]